jgi:hypothetical protein
MGSALVSKTMVWVGRVVSALLVLGMLLSGVMKLVKPDGMAEQFEKLDLDDSMALGLGILEIACTIVYAIPRTSVLGAILLTGYLGGAILTHVRIGDPFIFPIIFGVLVWGGLYLRDARLRALLPLRS